MLTLNGQRIEVIFKPLTLNAVKYSYFLTLLSFKKLLMVNPNPGGYKKERSRAAQGHI
jgi:hypothetical protein